MIHWKIMLTNTRFQKSLPILLNTWESKYWKELRIHSNDWISTEKNVYKCQVLCQETGLQTRLKNWYLFTIISSKLEIWTGCKGHWMNLGYFHSDLAETPSYLHSAFIEFGRTNLQQFSSNILDNSTWLPTNLMPSEWCLQWDICNIFSLSQVGLKSRLWVRHIQDTGLTPSCDS